MANRFRGKLRDYEGNMSEHGECILMPENLFEDNLEIRKEGT
jgi:hypothetical protein